MCARVRALTHRPDGGPAVRCCCSCSRSLADLIMEKIREKEQGLAAAGAGAGAGAGAAGDSKATAEGGTVLILPLLPSQAVSCRVQAKAGPANRRVVCQVCSIGARFRPFSCVGCCRVARFLSYYSSGKRSSPVAVFVLVVMSSLRQTGKIPKPFAIIPNLKNWEEILLLTEPDNW